MHIAAHRLWYAEPAAAEGQVEVTGAGQLVVTVSIKVLVGLFDPLHGDPWGVGGVRADQVETELRDGRLREENPCWDDTSEEVDSTAHAQRIAWLIRYGWDAADPLHLDVDEYGGVGLYDGNHRLYALAYLGLDGSVRVELSGYLDIAESLLGVTIP